MLKIQRLYNYKSILAVCFMAFNLCISDIALAHESVPPEEETAIVERTISLKEVIERSLAYNPAIKEIDFELAEKLATAFEVEVLQNPELTADSSYVDGKGSPKWATELEQPIRFSYLGSRQSYATALEQVANLEQKAALMGVLNDTTRLYYDYWLLQEREVFLRSAEKQVKEVSHQAGHASERGEVTASDSNIFGAEALRISEELRNVVAQRKQLLTGLLEAIGYSWQDLKLSAPVLMPIPQNTKDLMNFAQTQGNLRNILLARQKAANARHKVAKQDSIFPEFTPRLTYDRSPRGVEEERGIGITLSIPLWDRNQGEVRRARSQVALADAELSALDRLNIDKIVSTLQEQAISAQERANSYRTKIFPAYQGSYKLTRRMFEAGQASMLQLWDVRKTINEVHETMLETAREALEAKIALEEVLGGKLEEIQ